MDTYKKENIPASVGYEIGQPAYPDPKHDPSHQLPLTPEYLTKILDKVQGDYNGGFFWEIFKPAYGHASPTDVAQALCKKLTPGDRCSGTFPTVDVLPNARRH